MSFFNKIQTKAFWVNFYKVTLPFFILVTLISLFLNSWRDIFSGDFAAVAEANFNDGKWIPFWAYKIVFSIFYGLYMTNKNMK